MRSCAEEHPMKQQETPDYGYTRRPVRGWVWGGVLRHFCRIEEY
jgi:hypothetical protein